MSTVRRERFSLTRPGSRAQSWLAMGANPGLAANTVEAYARAREDSLVTRATRRCPEHDVTRGDRRLRVYDLSSRPRRRAAVVAGATDPAWLANAALRQHITVFRLVHDCFVEEGLRLHNVWDGPVHSGPELRWRALAG